MKYIAVPHGSVDWLHRDRDVLTKLSDTLRHPADLAGLSEALFAEGPLRMAATPDRLLLGIWNEDYLTGTGAEPWGFIRYDHAFGLISHPQVMREVLERAMAVMSQRFNGLLIDQSWFFRPHPGLGSFTVAAGGGEEARRWTIGYFESEITTFANRQKAIVVVGPEKVFDTAASIADADGALLPQLAIHANALINEKRRRPLLESPEFGDLRKAVAPVSLPVEPTYDDVSVPIPAERLARAHETAWWSYGQWTSPSSPLTRVQKAVLENDVILRYPLRLLGPAGSGKSLLMQLLAMRRLYDAQARAEQMRLLYIVHNAAMASAVINRFSVLGADDFLKEHANQSLLVETLAGYARRHLDLQENVIISPDAEQTKMFQLDLVAEAFREILKSHQQAAATSNIFAKALSDEQAFEILSQLVMAEISTGIKGHGFVDDEKQYVESERPLSRFHGIMTESERRLVYAVFRMYRYQTFDVLRVLDSDDLAISLFGTLRTPIWELRRRTFGFDYVFVDETQLFNDNERRVLPYLTRGDSTHVPVVVALDQAQEIFGQASAGLASLGIRDIQDEALENSQRCSSAILDLAFFVIERCVDLFDATFPKFRRTKESLLADSNPLAEKPKIERHSGSSTFMRFIVRRIRELRAGNVRQIAVVCHADSYWDSLRSELSKRVDYFRELTQRGERLTQDQPLVVLTKPQYVGGQEFDAVICVGLEEGLTPPRVGGNDNVQFAVDQQSLREMYVAFTRARYKIIVCLPANAEPSAIIREAIQNNLIVEA